MRPLGTAELLEERRRLAVALLDEGLSAAEVAGLVGARDRSVRRWAAAADLAAVPHRGRAPRLTPAVAAAVRAWLDDSPRAFGFATERWTAPRLAAVLAARRGVAVHPRYLNAWLAARAAVTPQVPETAARERDEPAIARWVARRWPLVKKGRPRGARRSRSTTRSGSSWPRPGGRPWPRAGGRRSSAPGAGTG